MASILKKVLMAVTGLLLFGFVIGHLTGNFLLFKGAEEFNAYAEFLHSLGGLLIVIELGLVAFFVAHIYLGIKATAENRSARPDGYNSTARAGESTFASRTMIVGGIILMVFVVTHVWSFKYGDHSGEGGLWGLVVRTFQNPLIVAWYLLAMVALGLHLGHGFGSAFQSLGALKPHWRPKLKSTGYVVGWLIAAGFASMPVWSFLKGS